ncbi:hypothetical protein [uncultured Algibacter sp.]|uniref:hypothetical protein n=1 Tax=uncultured Algibacter sp. TaxID=298659 RepID=UPI002631D8B4|nr:hypothetical protein [uncultured Algibacter sp.]
MIRLSQKPTIIKNLNFNKKDKTLEIEFKQHFKTAQCINIPLSILQEYMESQNYSEISENDIAYKANLKIVHSNFKAC